VAPAIRNWPWPLQALLCVGFTIMLILAGFYIPGSPLSTIRAQLEAAQTQLQPLKDEVDSLRVYKQKKVELQSEMDALQKQLATLQTIVPEDKQADQFILMVQGAATNAGVSVRHLTAKPITTQPYYFEMPFQIEADGPYFSVLDFFSRLGRLSRIMNIGDLKLASIGNRNDKFHMNPGTSVTGTFTITTFFTQGADAESAPPAAKRR